MNHFLDIYLQVMACIFVTIIAIGAGAIILPFAYSLYKDRKD